MSQHSRERQATDPNVESQFAELLANHSKNYVPDNLICHFWHASLNPHQFPVRHWEIFVLVIICYSTLVTPYRAAFSTEHGNDWFDWMVDACFYFDILRMFWTSFDRGYEMETRKREIITNYLQGFFAIDVLSTVNWDIIVHLLSFSDRDYQSFVEEHPYMRLLKILKATRFIKAPRMIDSLSHRVTFNSAYIQTVKFFFIVVIFAHILACLFFLMPEILGCTNWELDATRVSLSDVSSGSNETLNTDAICMHISWRHYYSTADTYVEHMDPFSQWVQAMYWSLTTMTTIGYGDRGPQTQHEIAFTMVAEVLGLMIFAVLLNQITVFASAANAVNEFDNDIKNRLVQQLKNNNVPKPLIYKVVEYLCFAKSTHSYTNPDAAHRNPMSYLSAALQREIRVAINSPIIEKVGIFQERAMLRAMFDEADSDKGGFLESNEVKALLARVGMDVKAADEMMEAMDDDRAGAVTFDEFYQWYIFSCCFPIVHSVIIVLEKDMHFGINHKEISKPVPLCLIEELACSVTCVPLQRDELLVPVGEYGNALVIVVCGAVVIPQLLLPEAVRHHIKTLRDEDEKTLMISADSGQNPLSTGIGKDGKQPLRTTSASWDPRDDHGRLVKHGLGPVTGLQALLPDREFAASRKHRSRWSIRSTRKYTEVGYIERDMLRACLQRHWPDGLHGRGSDDGKTAGTNEVDGTPRSSTSRRPKGEQDFATPKRRSNSERGSLQVDEVDPTGGTLESKAWCEFLELKQWYVPLGEQEEDGDFHGDGAQIRRRELCVACTDGTHSTIRHQVMPSEELPACLGGRVEAVENQESRLRNVEQQILELRMDMQSGVGGLSQQMAEIRRLLPERV